MQDASALEAMSSAEEDIEYSEEFEASGTQEVTATVQSMPGMDRTVTASVAEDMAASHSGM